MKMNALAYAAIDRLSLVNLRVEPCRVNATHEYIMNPAPVERFIYIMEGKVNFFFPTDSLPAGALDMVYLPRDTAYRSRWEENARFMVVDLSLRDSDGQDIRFGDAPCVLFHDAHRVYDGLLTELADKADAKGPFDWLERLSLCFRLLCDMARDTNKQELEEDHSLIKEGVDYLEKNLSGEFSVGSLAQMCNLSASGFRRIFLKLKGMSPVEYRNRLRIRKATALLHSGMYTVGEVAEQVGIRDIQYFGKLFKRYTGMNPSVIKKGDLYPGFSPEEQK